jgi:hypothetical protein
MTPFGIFVALRWYPHARVGVERGSKGLDRTLGIEFSCVLAEHFVWS